MNIPELYEHLKTRARLLQRDIFIKVRQDGTGYVSKVGGYKEFSNAQEFAAALGIEPVELAINDCLADTEMNCQLKIIRFEYDADGAHVIYQKFRDGDYYDTYRATREDFQRQFPTKTQSDPQAEVDALSEQLAEKSPQTDGREIMSDLPQVGQIFSTGIIRVRVLNVFTPLRVKYVAIGDDGLDGATYENTLQYFERTYPVEINPLADTRTDREIDIAESFDEFGEDR